MTFGFGDQRAAVNTTSLYAEGGSRTLGPLRAFGFQDRRVRPLRHLSIIKKKTFSDHEIRKGHPMQTFMTSDYDINSPDFMRTLTNHLII